MTIEEQIRDAEEVESYTEAERAAFLAGARWGMKKAATVVLSTAALVKLATGAEDIAAALQGAGQALESAS